MNIYLIERTDYVSYDEYDGAVVIAASADEAREMFPCYGWTYDAALIRVTLVGVATPDEREEKSIILSSFRAG